jgi:hypothetical protein
MYQKGQQCDEHPYLQPATSAGETFVMMGLAMLVSMDMWHTLTTVSLIEGESKTMAAGGTIR